MTTQALQAVLGSGAAPPSAGAAPVSGTAPPGARARWLRRHQPGLRAAAPARHPGQRVLAAGPVASGQNEARLIRVATVAAPS